MSAMMEHRSRDSIRDAERYYDVVLALTAFTTKIQQIKEKGFYSIDEVFEELLPDLMDAFKAEVGFLAEIVEAANGDTDSIKLSVVHPDRGLRGKQWQLEGRLKDLTGKNTPTVIDPLVDSGDQPLIHELGILNATSAILVKAAAFGKIHLVGVCNKKPTENNQSPESDPFLAIDGKVLQAIVELIAAGAQVGEQHQRELGKVLNATRSINAKLDIDELYLMIVENISQLVDAPAASLMLWDDRRQNLVIKAGIGLSSSYMEEQKLPEDLVKKLVIKAQQEGYLVIENLQKTPVGNCQMIIAENLFSSLSIMISESDQMIGVLNIYSKGAPRTFSPHDIERARIFASQVPATIRNAQLRKNEIEEASTKLMMFREVIQAISGVNQLEDGLQALAQSLVTGLKVAFCVIFTFVEQDDYLKLIAAFPVSRPYSEDFNWRPERVDGLDLNAVPEMKQVLNLNDTETYKISESSDKKKLRHIQESLHIQDKLQAAVAIPLVAEGKSVGLCIIGEVREWERSPFDQEAMSLAQSATLGVVQLISFLRARETEKLFQERMDNLRKLSDEIVQGKHTLNQALQNMVTLACQISEADCAVLYPYLSELHVYDVQNIVHYKIKEDKNIKAKYRTDTEGVAAHILRGQHQRVIFDNVDDGWDRYEELPIDLEKNKFVSRENIKAFIALGLFVGEKSFGVLFVNFRQPHKFSKEEIEDLQIYANQAALTIQQAHLYEEAVKLKEAVKASRKITRCISVSQELDKITQSLLSNAVEVTEAEIGNLILWDDAFTPTLQTSYSNVNKFEEDGGLINIEKTASILEDNQLKPYIIPDIQVWRPAGDDRHIDDFPTNADTKSLIIIPILRHKAEQLYGAMILESKAQVAFNINDGELLLQLASYVEIAVQSIENKGEIKDHLKLLEGTLNANQSITGMAALTSAAQDTSDLLENITENVWKTLGCDAIVLYQYYQNNNLIDWPPIVAGEIFIPEGLEKFRYVDPEGIVGKIKFSDHPHFADHSPTDELMGAAEFVKREKIISSAGIPLIFGEETVGILFVNYRRPNPFSEDQKRAIELLALQLAIAIHNIRLLRGYQKRTDQLLALFDASEIISQSTDKKEILDAILEKAVDSVIGYYKKDTLFGSIEVYDRERKELVLDNIYPPDYPLADGIEIGCRRSILKENSVDGRIGITGRAVVSGKIQRVGNIVADEDYVLYNTQSKSEMAIPIKNEQGVIAVLDLEHTEKNAFDGSDEAIFKALADFAAVTINNIEESLFRRRAQAIAFMGSWGANVVHDVNREVGAIRRQITILQQNESLSDDVKDKLMLIDSYAGSIDFPELPVNPENIHIQASSPLDKIIRAESERFQKKHPAVVIDCELQCSTTVINMHEEWLRRILQHLLQNARKNIPKQRVIKRIIIRSVINDSGVEVQVEDNGSGIPVEILPKLFYERIEKKNNELGGFGLMLVGFLVEQHGGKPKVFWNRPGEGACVGFTIPVGEGHLD